MYTHFASSGNTRCIYHSIFALLGETNPSTTLRSQNQSCVCSHRGRNGFSPCKKGSFLFNHTTPFLTEGLEKSLCDFTGTIFVQCENPVSTEALLSSRCDTDQCLRTQHFQDRLNRRSDPTHRSHIRVRRATNGTEPSTQRFPQLRRRRGSKSLPQQRMSGSVQLRRSHTGEVQQIRPVLFGRVQLPDR